MIGSPADHGPQGRAADQGEQVGDLGVVLVAYDGGRGSRAALAWAAREAERSGATVRVMCVAEPPYPIDEVVDPGLDRADAALSAAEEWLRQRAPGVAVERRLGAGDPATVLVAAAADADLVVIGSKRGDAAHPARFELVPRKVAAVADAIVVVVPATWTEWDGRVVVGVGEEEVSDAPIEFAAAVAERRRVPLAIVHAWSSVPSLARAASATFAVQPPDEPEERATVAELRAWVQAAHPDLDVVDISIHGNALLAMIAEGVNSSLAVVGRRRTGLLAEWLLGSVTHELLVELPCPVAVVPTLRTRSRG